MNQHYFISNTLKSTIFGRLFWNNRHSNFFKYKNTLDNLYTETFSLGKDYQGKLKYIAIKKGSSNPIDWSIKSSIIITTKPCLQQCNSIGIVTEDVKILQPETVSNRILLEKSKQNIPYYTTTQLKWNNEDIDLGILPTDIIKAIAYLDKNEIKYTIERIDERLIIF